MKRKTDPSGDRRAGRTLAAAAVGLIVAGALLAGAQATPRQRRVQVTVVTDKGAAVPGLSPADFVINENGDTRTILEAAPSTARLAVALLLDDRGGDINEIRRGLAAFVARLDGRADVSLVTVVPTTTTVFDYTGEVGTMLEGIRRLVWRSGPASGLLLGAIADAADTLGRREAARPAIVVVTFEGAEFKSHRQAKDVLASLDRSRAALHVVAVGRPTLRRMNRAAVDSGDVQGDEWTVDENNRNAVLGEGPRRSGGRRYELAVVSGLDRALETVASDLLNQYTLVYESRGDRTGSTKLKVSVKQRGVTVRAPSHVP